MNVRLGGGDTNTFAGTEHHAATDRLSHRDTFEKDHYSRVHGDNIRGTAQLHLIVFTAHCSLCDDRRLTDTLSHVEDKT